LAWYERSKDMHTLTRLQALTFSTAQAAQEALQVEAEKHPDLMLGKTFVLLPEPACVVKVHQKIVLERLP
jgi:hypothetical protein